MERDFPDAPSDYSDEGTAAHFLAAEILTRPVVNGLPLLADQFLGYIISVGATTDRSWEGAWFGNVPHTNGAVARRKFEVDDEMAENVQTYVDQLLNAKGDGNILFVEQRGSISQFTGEKNAIGTSDGVIVVSKERELQVHDLKYGMGVQVFAKKNKQLMTYALSQRDEMEQFYGEFENFRLFIHQPRLGHMDEWVCSAAELREFEAEIRAIAPIALALYHSLDTPEILMASKRLVPSDKACKFCKAKATCPALAQRAAEIAEIDFRESREEGSATSPREYAAATLAEKMAAVPLLEMFIKGVRGEVERRLVGREDVPGWKLVMGRQGNRKWGDKSEAEAFLKEKLRLKVDDMYKKTLLEPPAIEKVLKSAPAKWVKVTTDLKIVRADGVPSVAPEADKRPAYVPPDPAKDFDAIDPVDEVM